MRIKTLSSGLSIRDQTGLSLIELIVFIVVIAVGLSSLLMVFNQSVVTSVDPVVRIKALEKGQALMDEILARKFDENTPTGGVPACDTSSGPACLGIVADSDYDDVGDYNGYSDNSEPGFSVSAQVTAAGSDLGLPQTQARLIRLSITMPGAKTLMLSAYKVNF